MLENLLKKYDKRYQVSIYSNIYKNSIIEDDYKKYLQSYATMLLNPKPFLDGVIIGSGIGFGISLISGENYGINIFGTGVGLGVINQQQYYIMTYLDYIFDIFSKKP